MSNVNFNGGMSVDDIAASLNIAESDLTAPGLQTGLRTPGQAATVNLQADASASKAAAELVADGLHKSGKLGEAAAGSGAIEGTSKVNSAGATSKASALESMSAVGAGIDIAASVRSDMASGIPDIARPDVLRSFVDSRHNDQLSLESLIDIFNGKSNADAVKNAKSAVLAGSAERINQSNERIEELKGQIEKIEAEKNKSIAQKIFDALKAAVQVIGAVVAVATAVLCPNPLTIAAAVLTCMSTVEGLMSTFSDGELSFGSLCSYIDKQCGGDGKIGQIIASVVQAAVGVATSVMSSQGLAQVAKAVQAGTEAAKQLANNLNIVKDLKDTYSNIKKAVDVATALGKAAINLSDPEYRESLKNQISDAKDKIDDFNDKIDEALDLSNFNHNKLLAALLSEIGVSEEDMEKIKKALSEGANSSLEGSIGSILDNLKDSLMSGSLSRA